MESEIIKILSIIHSFVSYKILDFMDHLRQELEIDLSKVVVTSLDSVIILNFNLNYLQFKEFNLIHFMTPTLC